MMKDDPDPDPRLVIDIAIPCVAWRRVPNIARLARDTVRATLAAADAAPSDAEISLVLTDDAEIQALNRRWRGQDRPTNVLSFPGGDAVGGADVPRLLGDVVLAHGTVAREAEAQGKRIADHTRHLIVHGVLHLLGHDHETQRDARRMEGLERAILAGFGIANPYDLAATGPDHG